MGQSANSPSREQQMYWHEFFQLKTDACYVREYRNSLSKWVTAFAAIRAIAATSSIGGWLIWKRYALLWAGLIAAAQLIDALKNVFPFYKRRRALSALSRSLNQLFVEAQRNWDEIAGGHCSNVQVRKLCHQIRSRKQKAEARFMPNGLRRSDRLFNSAQAEAEQFFKERYNLSDLRRPFDA